MKRFSQKFDILQKRNPVVAGKVTSIKTEVDCLSYGVDCMVAINRFNDTIQKFYRIFNVLNKEHENSFSTTNLEWNRYLGTLLANLNFHLNSNEEKDSDNGIQKLTNSKKNVAGSVLSLQLEKDLSKLLGRIVHTNEMPLIDMLMLLGYSSSIQLKSNGVLHSKASKEFVTTCKGATNPTSNL